MPNTDHQEEKNLLVKLQCLLADEYDLLLSFDSQFADQQADALELIAGQKIQLLETLQPYSEQTKNLIQQAGGTAPQSTQAIIHLHEQCERQNYTNGELLASYQERIEWSLRTLSIINGTPSELESVYNRQGGTGLHHSSGINQYS